MVNGLHNAPFLLFIPCIEVPSTSWVAGILGSGSARPGRAS